MGPEIISVSLIGFAIAGWLAAGKIPPIAPQSPDLKINFNLFSETVRIIKHASANRTVFLSILGISWFWLVGALYLAQFPTFSHDTLFADEMVSTLFVAIFTIGIAAGSLACNKLLKRRGVGQICAAGGFGHHRFFCWICILPAVMRGLCRGRGVSPMLQRFWRLHETGAFCLICS